MKMWQQLGESWENIYKTFDYCVTEILKYNIVDQLKMYAILF